VACLAAQVFRAYQNRATLALKAGVEN